jgi:hypothetical protein
VYFSVFSDQVDRESASYRIFYRYLTLSFHIQSDFALASPSDVMIVDVFKQSVSGFSVSRRFQATVSEAAVSLEEAPENQVKEAPADLDTLLGGTFRMGFLQTEAIRKEAIDLPHFEIIRRAEEALAKQREEPEEIDEEGGMDEEDDMDV